MSSGPELEDAACEASMPRCHNPELAEKLWGVEGCGSRILEGKGEFKHFCDWEVRRWDQIVFYGLWNQEVLRRNFSERWRSGGPRLLLSNPV
jgi:hypothetical protein